MPLSEVVSIVCQGISSTLSLGNSALERKKKKKKKKNKRRRVHADAHAYAYAYADANANAGRKRRKERRDGTISKAPNVLSKGSRAP